MRVLLPVFLVSAMIPFAEEAPASRERLLEGDWRGLDGNGHLTLRFQHENGSWLGFFVSERNGQLYPVEEA